MMTAFAGFTGSNYGIILADWALTVPVFMFRRASDNLPILPILPILPRLVAALEGLQE